MATHTISSEQLALDLQGILARARAGEAIHIEDGVEPPLVIQPVSSPARRTSSETSALLKAREERAASVLRMGEEYANDVQEIIDQRRPSDSSKWD